MRLLRLLNILSIDVALAAALLSLSLSRLWGIDITAGVPLILAIVVWIIYTLDHIKDSFDTQAPGLSQRRNFHQRHVKPLIRICILLLLVACGLLFTLPAKLILYGSALACLVGAYYLALHFLKGNSVFQKELFVAILYTSGIVVGPIASGTPPDGYFIQIFQLFLLALNNLLLFSWFDHDQDKKEGFTGMVQTIGKDGSRYILIILPVIQILTAISLFTSGFQKGIESIWLLMGLIMLMPPLWPQFWSKSWRYRIAGDLLFFLPSLFILLIW